MKSTEYKRIRAELGSQGHVADLLDVNIATIVRREKGHERIRRESEFALRWLAQEERRKPSPKVRRLHATPNGRAAPSTKKRKADRKASEFARCYHSEERVLFVKSRPCLVRGCKLRDIENAHTVNGGMGRKGPYDTIVPACRKHHREMHAGQQTFARTHELDLAKEARVTEVSWRMHENSLTGKA